MPTRKHHTWTSLKTELETAQWLVRQQQLQLDAHRAVAPNDIELAEALRYADGLGKSSPDRVPLRILATSVRALRVEMRLMRREMVQLRCRMAEGENKAAEREGV